MLLQQKDIPKIKQRPSTAARQCQSIETLSIIACAQDNLGSANPHHIDLQQQFHDLVD
jgi:hypothetical protein